MRPFERFQVETSQARLASVQTWLSFPTDYYRDYYTAHSGQLLRCDGRTSVVRDSVLEARKLQTKWSAHS